MVYEKSYEDYLFEEIQKYLLLILLETGDITYNKLVNKILINYTDNEDIITYVKQIDKTIIEDTNIDYLDFSKKTTTFVLEQILDTVKTVLKTLKIKVIDNPNKFFFSILKKENIKDKMDKFNYSRRQEKIKIVDSMKPSTVVH